MSRFTFRRVCAGRYEVRSGEKLIGTVARTLGGWSGFLPGYAMSCGTDLTRQDAAELLLYRLEQDEKRAAIEVRASWDLQRKIELRDAESEVRRDPPGYRERCRIQSLLTTLQEIVNEAGPAFGHDDDPGTINRMARLARKALALHGG